MKAKKKEEDEKKRAAKKRQREIIDLATKINAKKKQKRGDNLLLAIALHPDKIVPEGPLTMKTTKREFQSNFRSVARYVKHANSVSNTLEVEAKAAYGAFGGGVKNTLNITNSSAYAHSSQSKEFSSAENTEEFTRKIEKGQFALDFFIVRVYCFKGLNGENKLHIKPIQMVAATMDKEQLVNLVSRQDLDLDETFVSLLALSGCANFKTTTLDHLKRSMTPRNIQIMPFKLKKTTKYHRVMDDRKTGSRLNIAVWEPNDGKYNFGCVMNRDWANAPSAWTYVIEELYDEDAIAPPKSTTVGWEYKKGKGHPDRQICKIVAKDGYVVIGGGMVAGGQRYSGDARITSYVEPGDFPHVVTVKKCYAELVPTTYRDYEDYGWCDAKSGAKDDVTVHPAYVGDDCMASAVYCMTRKAATPTERLYGFKKKYLPS